MASKRDLLLFLYQVTTTTTTTTKILLKRKSERESDWRMKRVCSTGWKSHGSCLNKNWELIDFYGSTSSFRYENPFGHATALNWSA